MSGSDPVWIRGIPVAGAIASRSPLGYTDAMIDSRAVKATRFGIALIASLVLLVQVSLASAADDRFLREQLQGLLRSTELQQRAEGDADAGVAVIRDFIHRVLDVDEPGPETATAIMEFCRRAWRGTADHHSRWLEVILRTTGRMTGVQRSRHDGEWFAAHVREGIRCNRERATVYSQRSAGGTDSLSRLYIALEYSILPLARLHDRWARRLRASGVPVLENDFVSMSGIAPASTPPLRTGILSGDGAAAVRRCLADFQKRALAAALKTDFSGVADRARQAIHALRELEAAENCSFSLSIHLLESIGLAARNGELLRLRDPRSADFYRCFLITQLCGVRLFSVIDFRAQRFHQQGIGIISNDLPAIPFP